MFYSTCPKSQWYKYFYDGNCGQDDRGLYHKTFYDRNLFRTVVSYRVLAISVDSAVVYYLWERLGAYPYSEVMLVL
jgi:hypothetical protein